jgi:hypothetical protein
MDGINSTRGIGIKKVTPNGKLSNPITQEIIYG